jgi:hypothetical protein
MSDLNLTHLYVVTPGEDTYLLKKNIEVMGLLGLLNRLLE